MTGPAWARSSAWVSAATAEPMRWRPRMIGGSSVRGAVVPLWMLVLPSASLAWLAARRRAFQR